MSDLTCPRLSQANQVIDEVTHKRLMLKYKSLRIIGDIYNWIEDLLKDKEQRVLLHG